jgi:hypothetical protein
LATGFGAYDEAVLHSGGNLRLKRLLASWWPGNLEGEGCVREKVTDVSIFPSKT